jgi:hypothetical protein
MALESGATYPVNLNSAWPLDSDTRREGAAHIRETKLCLKNYAKTLSGAGAAKSVLEYIYPVGSLYVGLPNSGSNPQLSMGGTWEKAGDILIDDFNKGPNVPALEKLWAWYRLG